jgi:hypothetical protein
MFRLLLIITAALLSVASAATTRVVGHYVTADGLPAICRVKITPAYPFTDPSTNLIVNRTVSATCDAAGDIAVDLVPTANVVNPANSYYKVEVTSGTSTYTQKWNVPTTGPVNVKDIVISTVPAARYTMPVSQLDVSTLANGCMQVLNGGLIVDTWALVAG